MRLAVVEAGISNWFALSSDELSTSAETPSFNSTIVFSVSSETSVKTTLISVLKVPTSDPVPGLLLIIYFVPSNRLVAIYSPLTVSLSLISIFEEDTLAPAFEKQLLLILYLLY